MNNLHSALKLGGAPKVPADRIILLCQTTSRPAALSQFKCIEELWAEPTEMAPLKPGEEHETTVLCYSSGTTGRAKGVETTHYNITSQLQAYNLGGEQLDPHKDVAMGFLPFGHMYLFSTGIVSRLPGSAYASCKTCPSAYRWWCYPDSPSWTCSKRSRNTE